MTAVSSTTTVAVVEQSTATATGGERPPAAPPVHLASADAILEAIAGLKTSVDNLAGGLEQHKGETADKFDAIAQTVDALVTAVNGSLPPGPPTTLGSDGGVAITVRKIEPLSVVVPRVAAESAQARSDVAKLRETVEGVQAELLKQSSLMGIGKRGMAWAVSSEGRKQLAVLGGVLYLILHQIGVVH